MKKIVSALMLVLLVCGSALTFAACAPREEILRICTWVAYTDEKYVKKEFPKFYAGKTGGKKIKVVFTPFMSNEDVYEKITSRKMDFDVICPSDYMVQKLIKEERLTAIDKTVVAGYDTLIEPEILAMTEKYDAGNKYTMPYAWGTFGIMYNPTKPGVAESDMKSWNALWNKKPDGSEAAYKGKIYMKNSERDAFAAANIYNHRDELKAASENYTRYDAPDYQTLLNEMFATPDDKTMDDVKNTLIDQRRVFFKYESEDGKESMGNNKDKAYLGLFWSCDAGYAMQKNQNLRYSIPDEGSNVYVDNFVIPNTAGNTAAAQLFMSFLLDKETAYNNTMMSGASGTVIAANLQIRDELETMQDGFMQNAPKAFRDNYIDMVVFPSPDTLKRCALMQDYEGNRNAEVANMFASVKTARL